MKNLLLMAIVLLSQLCLGQVALMEDFEDEAFPPAGWTIVSTHATENWIRIGEDGDAISGSGSAAVNWAAEPQDESLVSPGFSLAGYTSAYLNFTAAVGYQYMVDPEPNGNLFAKISTDGGTTWTTLWVEEDEGVFDDFDLLVKVIDISAYAGQTNVKIKFQYVAENADFVAIDDISITACPILTGLTLNEVTGSTVTFSWDGTGGANIEYGAIGYTQGAGGTSVNGTGGSVQLTGLAEGTGYDIYIRPACGATATGAWQGPYTIYTQLTTPAAVPYTFSFETGTLEAGGWTTLQSQEGIGGSWVQAVGLAQEGEYAAAMIGSTTAASDAWMFSRGIELTSGTEATIKYYMRETELIGNGNVNNLEVSIGLEKTPAAQTTILGTYNDFVPTTYILQSHTWIVPVTGVYYIGFHSDSPIHSDTNRGAILVDNVQVTSAALGIGEVIDSQFAVYPNPAGNMINIANAKNMLINGISIVDMNGRTVKTVTLDNVSNVQINISDLASGIYVMNISSDKGTTIKKIVKK